MQEILDKLEKMRDELFDDKLQWQSLDFKKGYNQAINDLIKMIEKDENIKMHYYYPPIPPNTTIS
jgi:hypothetical protein